MSLEQQQSVDLGHALETASSDAELLQRFQALPVAVLKTHTDETGHTVLHQVVRSASARVRTTALPVHHSTDTSSRWSFRSKPKDITPSSRRHPYADGLDLLQYLVHCTDPQLDESSRQLSPDDDTMTRTSCYNSLVRVRSAGGSLPLHLACRYWDSSGPAVPSDSIDPPNLKASSMLDAITYLVATYPQSVQCPDAWGHLPLHEACANPVKPHLDVIVYLVQQWPEAVRTVTHDDNVPLHLAATSTSDVESKDEEKNDPVESPRSTIIGATDDLCGSLSLPEEQNEQGQRQLELVQYLVDYWPDAVHQTNRLGQTPLQCAQSSRSPNPHVIEFLLSFGEPDTQPSKRALRSSVNPFDDDIQEAANAASQSDSSISAAMLQQQASKPLDDSDSPSVGDSETKDSLETEGKSSAPNPFEDTVNDNDGAAEVAARTRAIDGATETATNPFEDKNDVGATKEGGADASAVPVTNDANSTPTTEQASPKKSVQDDSSNGQHQVQESTERDTNTNPFEDEA